MNINKEGTAFHEISNAIHGFKKITLEEMNAVSLMKRTDTKYIVNVNFLAPILEDLQKEYQVLEIDNRRIMNYSSVYFDTPEFKFYFDHHNGKVNRTKIRQRKYVDSELTFLEIKQKNGKGETNKSRIKIPDFELDLSIKSKEFISEVTGQKFDLREFDDLVTYLIISIIVGGRVGYIIFYNPSYYISNPLDIIKIWEGGMSFHGALIGVISGTYLFAIKNISYKYGTPSNVLIFGSCIKLYFSEISFVPLSLPIIIIFFSIPSNNVHDFIACS